MLNSFITTTGAFIFWAHEWSVLRWLLSHRTKEFTVRRITVSVSSLIIGAVVFLATIGLSRLATKLIERRIANKRHIDPGLRYTIVRLVRYLILTIGILVTMKQAFAVDLTSIAVIFTALSVGIGFGLQYLAA